MISKRNYIHICCTVYTNESPSGSNFTTSAPRCSSSIKFQAAPRPVSHKVPISKPAATRNPGGIPESGSEPIQKFSTSARLYAAPAPLVLLLLTKHVQKVAAVILGRSIRKWWKSLPPNKKQLFREWTRQRRWYLVGAGTGLLVFISLFLLTHLEESPVTGRSRLMVFSRENFMQLAQHASEECIKKYEKLFLPVSDPKHQVVEQVIQYLVQRNQDIDGINSIPWTVHVVASPLNNAFVLPDGKVFVFTGMLDIVDIHQLVFVMGHELAHALIGHAAEQASLSHMVDLLSIFLLTMIWAVCPRDSLAVLGHWVQGRLVQFMFDRPFSRKLEAEADEVGMKLAAKACADVRAAQVFWQMMELNDILSGEPTIPEWLSTHPSHRNRSTHLERLVPEALELRNKCDCPALPDIDPRITFSKTVQLLLERLEKEKSKAQENKKESEITVVSYQ
ncbi:metalloendopeptidase OMA1, mitochondrial [Trichomycterus rosablanca]|uniref:metalloendopeptidase OMA1, mitochondrial n=1 Tax=Trichomycterus rosablanca TaxID=2290929 RepID=UPI002F350459